MAKIDIFFRLMEDQKASHLFLATGRQPALRIMGQIEKMKFKQSEDDELISLFHEIVPKDRIRKLEETGHVVSTHKIKDLGRYRGHLYRQRKGISAVFKAIPLQIKSIEELDLPPIISKLSSLSRGLIIVSGPRESGRSTTLAAMLDEINRARKAHVVTIEDPIEHIHEEKLSIIDQQEVGTHIPSFASGFRNAILTGADVILAGELRNPESMRLALEAACDDRLVMAALSYTGSVGGTFGLFDFILHHFPEQKRESIRSMISKGMRAVILQRLFPRNDRKGFCAALEILVSTPAVKNLIIEKKTYTIGGVVQTGKKLGMQTMDDAIMKLVEKGWVEPHEAHDKAFDKTRFRPLCKKRPVDFTEC